MDVKDLGRIYMDAIDDNHYNGDGLEAVQRAVAWEAITVVHDFLNDATICEPIEAALERHFGFVGAANIQK